MSRRKGVKSEQSEQGEMMRAHTTCQKPYERRVSAYLSVAEACTQKMRKGLEYLHTENRHIKEKRVPNVRSK